MRNAKDILVIDDEAVVVQGLDRLCAEEGWSMDGAASGREGLRYMESGRYRLVICDIMMEDLDGFAFLAQAQRRGWTAPVVMTTGYSTAENAVRSLGCGALDFLPKPFTADEAIAVIHRALKCGRLRQTQAAPPEPCPPRFYRLGEVSWAEVEPSGTVRVGAQAAFLQTLEGVTAIELHAAGTELAQGSACAVLTSADQLGHGVMGPVSGRVLEANARVAADPGLVEREPYAGGWLYRVLPADLDYGLQGLSRTAGAAHQNLSDELEKGASP